MSEYYEYALVRYPSTGNYSEGLFYSQSEAMAWANEQIEVLDAELIEVGEWIDGVRYRNREVK